jgi:hypothetical protein
MHRLTIMLACIVFCLAHARSTFAQRIAVQEPSLETFGVGTTVSAPDRGRVSLGGVSRGKASRSTYGFGPFRSRPNMGLSSQATSLGVGVQIHDLAEMDRQALQAAENSRRARDEVSLSPAAERAYETLRARRAEQNIRNGAESAVVSTGTQATGSPVVPVEAGPAPEKLLDRAREAESAGKRGLALAYLRTARDAGSVEAGKEIDRLSRNKRQNPASR